MATINSIGSGKTYGTLAGWHGAFVAGGWIGEVYGELTDNLDFSGKATSAANYVILRASSGQGTAAITSTGPLRYDGTLGGAIKDNTAYGSVFYFHEDYVMLQGLQIQEQHVSASYAIDNDNTSDTIVIDRCIVESGSNSNDAARMRSGYIRNSLLENRGTSGGGILLAYAFPHIIACTIVRPSDKGAAGNGFNGSGAVAIDCAVYGFNAFNTGTMGTGSDYNSSDKTIPTGTHNQASKTYANQFVNTVDATRDFRAKAGADLLDNGVADSTTYPAWAVAASSFGAIDIIGTARPQGTAWDIACWELAATVTSYTLPANPGSYAITGAAAKLNATRKLAANPGSYAIAGAAAKLNATRKLAADPGSYAITGTAATPTRTRVLAANPGSYLISGVAISAAAARKLAPAPGSYTITGQAAAFVATRKLAANPGSYAITGAAAALILNNGGSTYTLHADPGAYAITGAAAKLNATRVLAANAGSYFVTGASASLAKVNRYILQADAGSYFITGRGAILSASGSGPTATSDIIQWMRRNLRK